MKAERMNLTKVSVFLYKGTKKKHKQINFYTQMKNKHGVESIN